MTKELFEKAQFGDRFVTRGGQEALFLRLTENSEYQFADFYVKDWGLIKVNRENGKMINGPDTENDIVGMIPSLPPDVDEAAHKFAVFYDQGTCDGIAQDCFKAGAEWMAGQGETRDDIVVTENFDGKAHIFPIPSSKFNPGDKVIVQIRKKQ